MAEPTSASLFHVWNNLQEKLSSAASSSRPFAKPRLKKLNDMVYEVHSPMPEERPQLEVWFFHGLQLKHGEDVYLRTWMSRDDSHLWLKTWLVDLYPKARILIISYDASMKKTDESGRTDMYCNAENLVHSLTGDEVSIGQAGCPIVLVGHCLGGLLLKELCIYVACMLGPNLIAKTLRGARIHDLFYNLRGMFFYGTPHNGSLLGDGLQGDLEGALVDDIKILKASSARRNQQFDKLKSENSWHTYGVGELRETYVDFLGKRIHVVPESSARSSMDLYYSVDADHHNICKPDGKTASSLTCLGNFLNEIQEVGICQVGAMVASKSSQGYVDLEGRANQVCSMLNGQEKHTIFITGLSGMGKTALAEQVYLGIGGHFQVTCFVSLDSIEEHGNNCGEQVLRKVWEGLDARNIISSHNHLSTVYYLQGRKVLMVLDNVESQDQLDALHTNIWLEGTASKLIVTTTTARLGTPSNTFEVTCLSQIESQRLFCHYAFEGGDGPHDLRHLISRVVHECANFPLSLKTMGGYVRKRNVHHAQLWLDLLDRLKKAQEVDSGRDYRLWAKLSVCFDVLQATEKELFLDIAAFFHGFPISLVECIWQGCRESWYIAWINLQERFLACVDHLGNIWMHNLLRKVGKRFACPLATSVAKWKRIWASTSAKELISVHQGIVDTLTLKLQISNGENLWLDKPIFINYVHLQYLSLEGLQTGSFTLDLPRSLVYLRWTNALFKVFPVDFTCLENLVALQVQDCISMESFSPTIVCATKLKWLELDGCPSFTKLPSGLSKYLQHFVLEHTAIRELPRDLGKFKRLVHLKVNSPHLTRIPQGLGGLEMLSSLSLSCTGLTALPESIGNLRGLRNLQLRGTSLSSLPESIGRLKELTVLDLSKSRMLSWLPESIGQLQSLHVLSLYRTCVKGLPQSIGDLAKLRRLNLNQTPLEMLPDCICNLHSLSELQLACTQIGRVPGRIGELVDLRLFNLSSKNLKAWPTIFGQLSVLRTVSIDIGHLANLHVTGLYSQGAGGQEQDGAGDIQALLSQLPLLPQVAHLTLQGRGFPQSWMQPLFRALHLMPSLWNLILADFNRVETIPHELGTLGSLKRLGVHGWETLVELPESLGELHRLTIMGLWDNPRLSRLPESLKNLTSLFCLSIRGCGALQSWPRSLGQRSSREGESSTQTSVSLDSWRLAKCFLECPGKHFARHTGCRIACKEVEKVRKKAFWRDEGRGYHVVDTKVAMELLGGRHDGFQEVSRPPYHSSSQHCPPHNSFQIQCDGSSESCAHHPDVRVMDLSEESEDNIEGEDNATDLNDESDEESQEGDSRAWFLQYFRGLCNFLLCSR